MLATGSSDGKVRLWNPRRLGELPIVVTDNPGWIWGCAFSPDGNALAVSSSDRSIHLIPTHSELMVGQIAPHITRNLTEVEWEEYIGTDVPYMKTVAVK
jgi:WD40 repeat protein